MSGGLLPGDVIVVRLPQQVPPGHEQEGARPVVVVGVPEVLGTPRYPMAVIVPLTSKSGAWSSKSPELYPVLSAGAGGLLVDSVALIDHVRGIDLRRVLRRLGHLDENSYAPVADRVRRLVGS